MSALQTLKDSLKVAETKAAELKQTHRATISAGERASGEVSRAEYEMEDIRRAIATLESQRLEGEVVEPRKRVSGL